MPEHIVRQGDTLQIDGVLADADGNPVPGSGATYEFAAGPIGGGDLIIDYSAADNLQTGASGIGAWSYEETPASAWPVGLYEGYVRATYAGGAVVTYPNDDFPGDGPILIRVTPKLPVELTTPLATTADLELRLGIALTSNEHKRAHDLLMKASGVIRSYGSRQTISFVEDDELLRSGTWGTRILLPQRPVVAVTEITLDGTVLDPDSYYIAGDEVVRSSGWGSPLADIAITYDHGWEDVPEIVRTICVEMVARVWVNPGSVQAESIAGVQATYNLQGVPRGLMMTDDEKDELGRLLGAGAGTVRLN